MGDASRAARIRGEEGGQRASGEEIDVREDNGASVPLVQQRFLVSNGGEGGKGESHWHREEKIFRKELNRAHAHEKRTMNEVCGDWLR